MHPNKSLIYIENAQLAKVHNFSNFNREHIIYIAISITYYFSIRVYIVIVMHLVHLCNKINNLQGAQLGAQGAQRMLSC